MMNRKHSRCVYGVVAVVIAMGTVFQAGASEHQDATYLRVETDAAVIQIHTESVARITSDSPGGDTGTVQTVNGSRFHGKLEHPAVALSGKKAVVSPVANASGGAWENPLYFIVLSSGDYLNGPIAGGTFAITTQEAADAGSLTDMPHITVQTEAGGSAGVTIGPDGAFSGTLRLDDIALVLEASPAIRVYDRREGANEVLATKTGDAVEPMQIIHMNGSRMVGYCVNQSAGVRVRNVSSGAPADRGGMEVGDWVLSIDGEPVSKGYDIWTPRDAVTAGKQQHVLLETRRGTASRWYLIVK